ncbi:regulatory Fis family protein [Paraburkholderia unamae]|uniref:sigma-54-dependent Fis family transcriptional regulator n=1 Tax=Paraburkholderia unamae TaxID=219649 RepID=UPI000DC3DA72|nr:sigma 54-interacting transcriptional regulator [Paraburkholderia unamae]RAR48833.1 regulatory Fis family protein [Paraburkholderia unamae]
MSAHKAAHHVPVWHQGNDPRHDLDEQAEMDSAMREVMIRGKRFIDRGLPVLILGETGTGKELLARALHAYGARRAEPIVALNCASIPETLIESELFGYARGAFSGALPGGMKGKLAQAHGGTLFLDEIGDMPAAQQARLLRALSEREITPLGAAAPVALDFQLICATHQRLDALVEAGLFRADLYYRVAVGVLHLPPLRERSDLRALALAIAQEESGRAVTITSAAWQHLLACEWPGNVRQLRAALRYACAVARNAHIEEGDLPHELLRVRAHAESRLHASAPRSAPPQVSADPHTKRGAQRERVLRVLAHTRWNLSVAARDLGICRSTLYRQLKSLGIPHIRDSGATLVDGESFALSDALESEWAQAGLGRPGRPRFA